MDRHTSVSLGTPAPYGQACANCVRSKCKCIIRHAGGPCERCRRLDNECRPAESVRRRSRRKPVVSRTARLEEKLDGLVSLIKAGAQSSGVVKTPHEMIVENSSPRGTYHPVAVSTPPTDGSTGSPYSLQPYGFLDTDFEPSPADAESYLINFQTYKSKYFPFIYILPTTRAQDLRQERPFLWLCIMTVGSKSTSQQQVLGTRIRQTVAQEMVIESEKSIDLLLGLLTFCWWAHYQVGTKGFLGVFTQLAISLVFDQGLNKQVRKDFRPLVCLKANYSRAPTPRTMEERRAVLGCFLVTSVISSFVQKIDALRWTPHLDECLQVLDEAKECFSDGILVQQVRLQLITERVTRAILDDGVSETTKRAMKPTSFCLEVFQSQLRDIKTELLAQPQTDDAVLFHLYNAELEVSLPLTFLHGTTLQPRKSVDPGVRAIKSWFDTLFAIPVATYAGLPFSILSQLVRCLVTLSRLISQVDSGWMENSIWTTADALSTMNRVIDNFEQVAELAGLDNSGFPEGDLFFRTAQMFRTIRPGMETHLVQDDLLNIPPSQSVNGMFCPDNIPVMGSDDDWLMDLLLSSNN